MNIKLHSCEYVVEFELKSVYKSNWISVENFCTLLRMFFANVWLYFLHVVLSRATATAFVAATATAITANSATPTKAVLTILIVAFEFEYVFLYIRIATSYKIRLLKLLKEIAQWRVRAITNQIKQKKTVQPAYAYMSAFAEMFLLFNNMYHEHLFVQWRPRAQLDLYIAQVSENSISIFTSPTIYHARLS